MVDKHLSSQFSSELNSVSTQIMIMGGLVEKQVATAIDALKQMDASLIEQVFLNERKVNEMEVAIDLELTTIIARRQPTARDLRLLIAISKATTNLERVGDEATKIARMARQLSSTGLPAGISLSDLFVMEDLVLKSIEQALDALARLDVQAAIAAMHSDDPVDLEFEGFTRKLVTFMMEDPRTISACLDLMFVAKALERVGDHATNIAEFVIYIVKGEDVRHLPIEQLADVIKERG